MIQERPTPETDAACLEIYSQGVAHIPLVGFMEKLERERDEANEKIDELDVALMVAKEDATNYFAKCSELTEQLKWKHHRVEVLQGIGRRFVKQRDALAEALRRLVALSDERPITEIDKEELDAWAYANAILDAVKGGKP